MDALVVVDELLREDDSLSSIRHSRTLNRLAGSPIST
jgi:hypothetical protein